MSGPARLKTLAGAGFAFICVFVLGGLIWATWLTVRLEDYELRALREEGVQSALWRLDNTLMPFLARETGRSYRHYSARYAPTSLSRNGAEVNASEYALPSPILEQDPPEWVDVYFQWGENGEPTSPQILPQEQEDRGGSASPAAPATPPTETLALAEALRELTSHLSYDELRDRFNAAVARDLHSAPDPGTSAEPIRLASAQSRGFERYQEAQMRGTQEWATRQLVNRQLQQSNTQMIGCDPIDVVAQNLLNKVENSNPALPLDVPEYAEVWVTPMIPVWLPREGEVPGLVLMRRVTVAVPEVTESSVYQGLLINWEKLRDSLLAQLAESHPRATLTPVMSSTGTRDHNVLATLPARLDIEPMAAGVSLWTWNEGRATLLLVWGVALVSLGVIGLGLRTLLTVSNRRVEFAYAVAHELRTPLTTFRLYTDMLAEGLVPEESRLEYLQTLNRESKRLADVVNGVLEYARIENRKVRLAPATIRADEFLNRTRTTFAKACADEGVQLVTDNQWEDGRPLTTDVELVLCVLGVLVANACRHGRNGDGSRVLVRLGEAGERIALDVVDTGPGIEASDVRALYKPFRRGKSAESRAKSGLGLGLALAKNWCGLLGGRLELVHRKDPTYGGAHFRMTLPQLQTNGVVG